MRIACPGCSAEYEVPEAMLATGPRMLKCARCAAQFEAAAPGAPAAPAPAESRADGTDRPPPTRGLPDRAPIDPPLPRREDAAPGPPRGVLALAWIATIVAVAAGIWAGLTWRAEIMEAWPPATWLYRALGLG